jgi:hypothetical protein
VPRLSIDPDGVWRHDGEEVTHPGILANLAANLQVDEGGYYLQLGPVRVPVEVADTPLAVIRLEADAGGASVVLSDGSRERLDPATLRLGDNEVPYCRVRQGRFEARLTRAAAWQLLRDAVPDEGGRPVVSLGGAGFAIPRGRTGTDG